MAKKQTLIRVIKNGKWIAVENELEALQREVGGYIETLTLFEEVVLIMDEEGRLKGKEPSCICLGHIICGDCIIAGVDGDQFADLDFKTYQTLQKEKVITWI